MKLHNLVAPEPNRKTRKRLGRGEGSGLGQQSGKGHKGQKAISGYNRKRGFEGGQMPLIRRVPKFGFKNPFRVEYRPVNVETLEAYVKAGKLETTITLASFVAAGLANEGENVKVLGRGDVTTALTIEAHAFSATAVEKLEKAGGKTSVVA